MKQVLSLLKVQFKQSYRKGKGADRSKKGKIGMALLYIFCAVVLTPYLFASLYLLSSHAVQMDAGREYMSILMLIIQGFALLFGTISIVNVMFLSKDNEILMALPIAPKKVFTAKFLYVLLHELVLGMVIGFVGIGIYGYLSFASVPFYILGGIAVILAPILSLAISSILLLPIILVCVHLRKKPVIAGLVSLVLFCGGMYLYMHFIFGLSSSSGYIGDMTAVLFDVIAPKLAFNMIVADVVFLAPNFLTSLAYAICLYVGLFCLACVLTSKVYKSASTLTTEKSTFAEIKSKNTKNGVMKSLILCDLKRIVRFPMLMITCISQIVIAPIVIFMISGIYNDGMDDISIGIMFMMGTMFVCGINYFAACAFTRENDEINILKSIPVMVETIVTSKLILAIISAVVTNILVTVALLASGIDIISTVLLFVYFGTLSPGMIAWQIKGDLDKPKLGWKNVNEGIKNNKSATIPLFTSMGIGMIGMYGFLMIALFKPNLMLIVMALLISLSAIFSILQLRSLYKNADRLFAKIEF
ncbi:MAG: hypothetical protein R3Y65_07210 [Bacillota bacterium]